MIPPARFLATAAAAVSFSLVSLAAAADAPPAGAAEVKIGYSDRDAGFSPEGVAAPAMNDAGAKAVFKLVAGTRDANGGDLTVLNDGKLPASEDSPRSNFFLAPGTDGGRLSVDLGKVTDVESVATYSWHQAERAPQVYKLYAADGKAAGFNGAPELTVDPAGCGWTLLATVDTRRKEGAQGGQHAVSIARKEGLGKFQYLLFAVDRSSQEGRFGQTFFSEIDVLEAGGAPVERLTPPKQVLKEFATADQKYRFTVDATLAPDLLPWVEEKLVPVVVEWYPKMVALLPSEGYRAPEAVLLDFKNGLPPGVPAYASANRVTLNIPWFRTQLDGEARGCVVHELAHVVQNYWRARMTNPKPTRTPGWVTEGIPDYIRWFLFEPQSGGAKIRGRQWEKVKYDNSYRVTANFLDWVARTNKGDVIGKLNAAAREGKYDAALWQEWTGKTLDELDAAWKKDGMAAGG